MAIEWNFKEKSGTVTMRIPNGNDDVTLNLYIGNAFLIAVDEWEDRDRKMYNLAWFFASEDHAKMCLGIAKKPGAHNIFEGAEMKRIVLYRDNCRSWKKITALFTKAFPEIEIVIRKGEG